MQLKKLPAREVATGMFIQMAMVNYPTLEQAVEWFLEGATSMETLKQPSPKPLNTRGLHTMEVTNIEWLKNFRLRLTAVCIDCGQVIQYVFFPNEIITVRIPECATVMDVASDWN